MGSSQTLFLFRDIYIACYGPKGYYIFGGKQYEDG